MQLRYLWLKSKGFFKFNIGNGVDYTGDHVTPCDASSSEFLLQSVVAFK